MTKPLFNQLVLLAGFFCCFSASLSAQCVGDTTKPFFERCPQNIVINQSTANSTACLPLEWSEPLAADNCGVASLTSNRVSGECFAMGVTTITYTAIDSSQNFATCSFTITILPVNMCSTDTTAPIIANCPQAIMLNTADTCAIATWTEPTATDNCSAATLTASHVSGACFPLGSTLVTYTAKDSLNNSAVCNFQVIVANPCANDTTKPVFASCPANLVLSTTGVCAAGQWIVPRATDNCGTVSVFATAQPGRCFPVGLSNVTYRATDLKGNVATCTFTVSVSSPCAIDTIKPTILNCPTNIALTTNDTCAVANWAAPTATDNCSIAAIVPNFQPGSCFPLGMTAVVYAARDSKGNIATCTFNVFVEDLCANDTIKPVITNCPLDIVRTTLDTAVTVTWNEPTVTDNCGVVTFVDKPVAGARFDAGTTTLVTYFAKDSKNNAASCSFNVIIISPCAADTIKPVLTACPANIVLTTLDTCAVVQWTAPTATDNCGTPSVSSNFSAGTCFRLGATTVNYVARDARNNTANCSFTVTVVNQPVNPCASDFTKPVLSRCPSTINLVSIDTCTFVNWTAPTATDNCGTPTVLASKSPNTCFKQGSTTVTYTATDQNNNSATCSFIVVITKPCANDTVKPKFPFCPASISLTTYDSCAVATWVMPVATDNCSSATVTSAYQPGTCFKVGVRTVVYTAKDANNNVGTCSFKVTVTNPCLSDVTKPVIRNCPANIVLNTADSCAKASWTAPTVTDNCGTPTISASNTSGTCFKVGVSTVTYTAKDTRNNTSLCTFTVTVVNPCFRDSIKPVIKNCPANIALNSADSCSIARWTAPTATDNCGTPTLTASHASGLCFRVGSTTVTYTAKDAKNNVALCTFKVTVSNPCFNDTIKPVLYNCPLAITKSTPDTLTTATWTAPTALDNCGIVTISSSNAIGSYFNVGTTTVVYTATDAKNNKSSCSFTVNIKRVLTACSNDTVKPVFTNCPANITVTTTSTSGLAQWTLPTATDNCSTPSVSGTFSSGASFPVGTTAVVFTAKDAALNLNYCRFTVTIVATKNLMVLDSSKCYALVAKSSKKALSVANSSTTAGAYAVQWTFLNTLAQKWKISPADSNSYNFTSRMSNLNLDTRWGVTTEGARLTQWGKSLTAATQKWQLTMMPDGFYKIINKGSGRALSVSGGSAATADGTLLIQSNYTMQTSQLWSIAEVPCAGNTIALSTNDVITADVQPEFNRARIEWSDNTGYKNDYYEVQKLNQTSGEFERMEIVNNKSISNAPTYQTAYDNAPVEGDNVYRVKVVYLDSLSKFSEVKTLKFNGLETVKLFPNPANDYVDIDLAKFNNETIGVYIYNGLGNQVAFQLVQKDKYSVVHFDVSNLQMGNYMMRISAKGKRDVLRPLHIVR
jgi:HYR domain/Ricin-type beta-trefoil lectin domain-like/Secretion system C-terminal sorting domain